jgi:glycosyltransferase involved in cell wall biosynthesis
MDTMAQAGEELSISVIVPVLNVAKTVRDLMESLMRLDYDDEKLEIIVVDGDSKDGTREIVQEYPFLLVQQEGKGLNAARNTGIKYSKGEIIAYTDGDCVVPPGWVKAIVANFRDPGVGFVGGTLEGYDKNEPLSNYMDETFFQVTPGFRFRIEGTDLRLLQFPAGANMAFSRDALARVDFFDENITYGFDDLEPVEEMGLKGFRIVLDPEVNVLHQHRSTLGGLMKQHFNYGRGGTLLLINKRTSNLAYWFSSYMIFMTGMLAFFLFMMYLWHKIRHPLPLNLGLGSLGLFMLVIMLYYLPVSVSTGKPWKLLAYPVLDLLRGLAFAFGGVYQMFKSTSQKVIR